MNSRGYSLAELLVVLAIFAALGVVGVPIAHALLNEWGLLGSARLFKGEFLRARSMAAKTGVQTAIRFEPCAAGSCISVYRDGNRNGVLSADILAGKDVRVSGPVPLDGRAPRVRVGVLPGVPSMPPDTEPLDPANPIRFGRSAMVSFSPLGTATPGTFYLAARGTQAGVRVTGGSARVRVMIWRGGVWRER
jgi:prepilin-type N-terminal cleavage/methylation domain-containing protein